MRTLWTIIGLSWLIYSTPAIASDNWRYLPDQSGLPQGGVILRYPDVMETTADRLSNVLSDHGWSVLLVPIPDTTSPQSEPVPASQLVRYMTEIKGQFNLVVLSFGDTWDKQLNLVDLDPDDDQQNPIQGIVLVDVAGLVNAPPELPLLDINTLALTQQSYVQRRKNARKNQLDKQQGINLKHYSTRARHNGENLLDRRIRGWLHHNVKGMEIIPDEQ
tara:strand:+ start:1030 stop:1683 length:654 start_codon:yes stop_codon:yes gene_type:complete